MKIPMYAAYCCPQECSALIVVVIVSSPKRLRESNFSAPNAAGPQDHCAHFQRRAYAAID